MLNSNRNNNNKNLETGAELDPFATKLNSPFYRFFDYLSQYLILNLSMAIVSGLSLHLLDYFSFNACSRLFLLDKEDLQSASWGKFYFKELKNNLRNKKMHLENFLHISLFFTIIFCFEISVLIDDVSSTTRFISSLIGIISFLLFFSQRLWAGPLRNLYEQPTSRRNFLLYFVFFLRKILHSIVLFILQFAILYIFTILPAIILLIYAPLISLVSCIFVKHFDSKIRR